MKVILVLLWLGSLPLFGAEYDDDKTKGLCNGRFWTSVEQSLRAEDGSVPHVPEGTVEGLRMPHAQAAVLFFKMAFVSGAADAAAASGLEDYYFLVRANDVSVKEIILALDVFYKTPENLRVPIVWAMTVVSLRSRGASFDNVEELIALYRKRSAEPGNSEQRPLTPDEFMKSQKK